MRIAMLSIIFFLSILCSSSNYGEFHHVKFVYDGDTILLENDQRVRYVGIDSPEMNHPGRKKEFMAVEARRYNSLLLAGKRIWLEFDKETIDRHGRLLAYVFIGKDKMINKLLVERGLARVMTIRPNLKYRDDLLETQRKAMKGHIGIWSRPFICGELYYIANRASFLFHRPGCVYARKISLRKRDNQNNLR